MNKREREREREREFKSMNDIPSITACRANAVRKYFAVKFKYICDIAF